jgi:hypothetical protein
MIPSWRSSPHSDHAEEHSMKSAPRIRSPTLLGMIRYSE